RNPAGLADRRGAIPGGRAVLGIGSLAKNLSGDFSVPGGNIALWAGAVRRDSQLQCLVARVGGLQCFVQHAPVVDFLLRLNKSPVDAEIGNRSHRIVLIPELS